MWVKLWYTREKIIKRQKQSRETHHLTKNYNKIDKIEVLTISKNVQQRIQLDFFGIEKGEKQFSARVVNTDTSLLSDKNRRNNKLIKHKLIKGYDFMHYFSFLI